MRDTVMATAHMELKDRRGKNAETAGATHLAIGVIGQGYVGKNYADDLCDRGYEVVRYALEDEYKRRSLLHATCRRTNG